MSLINQEMERRRSGTIKSRLSRGFTKAKETTKAQFNKAKADFKEKQEFNEGLKLIEKAAYKKGLKTEAARSGRRKAKAKFSGNRIGSTSKAVNFMKNEGFLGFGDQPAKKKKKEDNAFNMF